LGQQRCLQNYRWQGRQGENKPDGWKIQAQEVDQERAKVFATNLFPTRGKNTAKKIANLAASF
jgi:hypothetical protein